MEKEARCEMKNSASPTNILLLLWILLASFSLGCNKESDDKGGYCGNGYCEEGEGPTTCPVDCVTVCGDGSCSFGEDGSTCPQDCALTCGNGTCDPEEILPV